MLYLDTHVLAWLYAGRTELLPEGARRQLGSSEIRISPVVMLELQYLYEIERLTQPAAEVVGTLTEDLGLVLCDLPFATVARASLDQSWTRDPFDRMIVGQASHVDSPLLTKDRTILENYPRAVWGG